MEGTDWSSVRGEIMGNRRLLMRQKTSRQGRPGTVYGEIYESFFLVGPRGRLRKVPVVVKKRRAAVEPSASSRKTPSHEHRVGVALNRLRHPNLVETHDHWRDGRDSYLVLEKVFGRPFTSFAEDALARGDARAVRDVFLQALCAIADIQSRVRFTHYDLHLNNVMVVDEPIKKKRSYRVFGNTVEIETRHLVKLIDYESSYVEGVGGDAAEAGVCNLQTGQCPSVHDPDYDFAVLVASLFVFRKTSFPKELNDLYERNMFTAYGMYDHVSYKNAKFPLYVGREIHKRFYDVEYFCLSEALDLDRTYSFPDPPSDDGRAVGDRSASKKPSDERLSVTGIIAGFFDATRKMGVDVPPFLLSVGKTTCLDGPQSESCRQTVGALVDCGDDPRVESLVNGTKERLAAVFVRDKLRQLSRRQPDFGRRVFEFARSRLDSIF